ncbi:MAG TPA: ClbS/DfsB family four-helix bundle protein [Ktedonobacterales bacterium]
MNADTTNRKAELLSNLRAEHEALIQTLGTLTEAQLTQRGVHGEGLEDWSVKDILSHITWWEQSIFGWLGREQAVPRGALPASNLSEDEANSFIFEQTRALSPSDVLANFERSYTALHQAIEAASEEQLARGRPSDPDGSPLLEIIPGNSYDHYHVHNDAIRAWLNGGNSASRE